MDALECIKRRIEETVERSRVPEDPLHARNTLEWLLKLKSDADVALQIAALGHDIERAMEERKVRRENFSDYKKIIFKIDHPDCFWFRGLLDTDLSGFCAIGFINEITLSIADAVPGAFIVIEIDRLIRSFHNAE